VPIAEANGVQLNYLQTEEPDGQPRPDLVMIHGLATNMAFWYLPYAPIFAKRFRVTLYDLRGLGRSQMTPGGYTPDNLARDLSGLLDHLGIARAHILAHSFGGVVALNLACAEPRRVQSLVLADTHIAAVRKRHGRREWGNRSAVQKVLDAHGVALDTSDPYFGYRLLTEVAHLQIRNQPVPQALLDLLGPMMSKHGKRTAAQWVKLMDHTEAEAQLMGDDGLTLEKLRRLHMPILALYGDHSQARLTGKELLEVWPHAEFRRVRDAGHFFPASRPDDVIAECERFWNGDFAHKPVVRAGEVHRRHFRSNRVFRVGDDWHFTARENQRVGPFASAEAAHEALAHYVSALAVAA
jgi:pimeloyl-ACP methyl ester carboxylesterase